MSVLTIDDVSFAYAGGRDAVEGVSLQLRQGEVVSLLGANGSGKSTLLKLAARIEEPASGSILLGGRSDWTRREWAQRIGYLAQSTELLLPVRGIDVVVSGRASHLSRFEWEGVRDFDAAAEAMRLCDAEDLAEREADRLSGGERKRLLLARAIVSGAPLLLLDEPLAALDLEHVQRTTRLFRALAAEGKTVLFASHDLNWSAACSDRMIVMNGGRIVADASPRELLEPDSIRRLFSIDATVIDSPDGGRWVIPAAS